MGFEQCYRCHLDEIPKSERGGDFQAIHRGDPEIPFIGILCIDCAKKLGDWLKHDHVREQMVFEHTINLRQLVDELQAELATLKAT